ncbi:lysM and putative peptidoglycan-binding domain-containing protein 1 isoform X1 [Anopheles darlingi]|uniref:lysM and putative peptidoglycan-binding domain-containing protein 1 isoform X1 n=2 Tax=Anopheles darlingi TaxID=43151 RepID=UPI0021005947|nr:lysM and putative peptidoglycan-binding domain-containing protein 1 isoform X1 [Anopheles darlingi]
MSLETMNDLMKKYKNWRSYVKFVKLVSDGGMEDETMFGEKQSIRESARSLKKYGSISGGSRSPATAALSTDALIRHEVERTDTLQGLALKYGCSMEQIRRVNRLLPTDTIFLRPFLMVPVAKDSPHYPKDPDAIIRPNTLAARAATMAAPLGGAGASGSTNSIVSNHNNNNNNNHHHHHHTASSSISSDDNGYEGSPLVVSPEEESRKNLEEFLGKIDSSIATTRKCIAEVQRNSDFVTSSQSDDNLFISSSSGAASGSGSSGYYSKPRAYSNASSSSSISSYQQYHYHLPSSSAAGTATTHHKRQSSSGSAASDTSQLIVMTQGKRVQSSLQKLERQQDELFEL